MFMEGQREALSRLLADATVPEEFYYYWNDVVNAVGYTPKLLLMCSAIESLTKVRHGEKDWEKVERVLGRELKEDLFGIRGNSGTGLRHRLTHGEYLSANDSDKDYVELIHKKIMAYFNDRILDETLLDLNVVNPQRHFVGNVEGGAWFIKSKNPGMLSLKSALEDFARNDVNGLEHHDLVYDSSHSASY